MYKDEVQKKNKEKLQRKFEEDNVPGFIRDYFYNFDSGAGKLNYYSNIMLMLKWMIEHQRIKKESISQITTQDIDSLSKIDIIVYLETLMSNGMLPSTIDTKKNILSSFWAHLVDEGFCNKNVIRNISKSKFKYKKKNRAKVPLPEDVMEMIDEINKKKNEFLRIRNLAIVRILKGTGIRESELAGLDLKDLYLDDSKPYIMVMGKGVYYERDADEVYVTKDAKLAFEEWIEIRNKIEGEIIDKEAVFINKNGNRLNENNIQDIFKKYSKGKITPHMMRHLYATVLYQETKHDIALVQEQLRHKDVNTTIGIYAASDSRSYKVLENL